jgi:hypothetical protein
MSTNRLTEEQLDRYAELAITAEHDGIKVDPATVTVLVDEVRRLQFQCRFLLKQIAGKDAASGEADRKVREFLGGTAEEQRRLEDGSTHTVQALQDAGEACVQQACVHAREEAKVRQEQYTLRAAVEWVLDEVGYMVDDERITAEVAAELQRLLRDALGLNPAATPAP